jgi:hypothetical protein
VSVDIIDKRVACMLWFGGNPAIEIGKFILLALSIEGSLPLIDNRADDIYDIGSADNETCIQVYA